MKRTHFKGGFCHNEILSDKLRAVEDASERKVNPSFIRMSNSIKINAIFNNYNSFSLNCV